MSMKPGMRFVSAVCNTEVVVVKVADAEGELCCGGLPMRAQGEARDPAAIPEVGLDSGTQLGKRYGCESSEIQLLCSKGGDGTLSFGGEPLVMIETKRLPSSD
ncbi:MAG: hypothetical protein VW684_08925 [Betaproteobacteria bacterium]